MNLNPDSEPQPSPIPANPHRSLWQKIGVGSLTISLVFHVILLAIGVIWVLQVIPAPEKVDEITPRSGGGPSTAVEMKVNHQRVQMNQPDRSRIFADGAMTDLTLPEPSAPTQMTSLGGLSTDFAGLGSGGAGKSGGEGPRFGGGLAPGMTDGNGSKSFFGITNPDKSALVGTFYDLKQTSDRQPTGMTDDQMRQEVKEIVRRGFTEKAFEKFYKAPRTLYQTRFLIPHMSADGAPAAFECEKEVQPKRWIVVYRGAVQAPKSGKFRFVGAADDLLAVRFNSRPVFDYGYTLAGIGSHLSRSFRESSGKVDSELAKEVRRLTPMRMPITLYPYITTPRLNKDIGGLAVGPEFEVREGQIYPVEILIAEIPGGFFSTSLLIEEVGVNYERDSAGSPILPLFRLDGSLPDPAAKGEVPPFDPHGPVWKFARSGMRPGI